MAISDDADLALPAWLSREAEAWFGAWAEAAAAAPQLWAPAAVNLLAHLAAALSADACARNSPAPDPNLTPDGSVRLSTEGSGVDAGLGCRRGECAAGIMGLQAGWGARPLACGAARGESSAAGPGDWFLGAADAAMLACAALPRMLQVSIPRSRSPSDCMLIVELRQWSSNG